MTSKVHNKENEKYGGKPYGEIKCPFFTKQGTIPEELNKKTVCSKCWSKYDYNCFYPKHFDCDQYNEMLKTLKPEYLKSIVDAMRTETDLDICNCSGDCDDPINIGTLSYGKAFINVLTYDKGIECAFIVDGKLDIDIGINIIDSEDES